MLSVPQHPHSEAQGPVLTGWVCSCSQFSEGLVFYSSTQLCFSMSEAMRAPSVCQYQTHAGKCGAGLPCLPILPLSLFPSEEFPSEVGDHRSSLGFMLNEGRTISFSVGAPCSAHSCGACPPTPPNSVVLGTSFFCLPEEVSVWIAHPLGPLFYAASLVTLFL